MKRCPECRRNYFDDSLAYCLDDGAVLLDGPPSHDESATAILGANTEPATSIFPSGDSRKFPAEPATIKRRTYVLATIVAAIVILGTGGYFYYIRATTKQISSIAVMPFVNESGNPDVEYLSDGMTETLIGSLSKMHSVRNG